MPRVETLEEFQATVGAYWIFETAVWVRCPECGGAMILELSSEARPYWRITQKDPLSLEPAIHHWGCWHGWLRGGEWVTQRDAASDEPAVEEEQPPPKKPRRRTR